MWLCTKNIPYSEKELLKNSCIYTIYLDLGKNLFSLFAETPKESEALDNIFTEVRQRLPKVVMGSYKIRLWTTYFCSVRDYFRSLSDPFTEEALSYVDFYFNEQNDNYFDNILVCNHIRSPLTLGALIEESYALYLRRDALRSDVQQIIHNKWKNFYQNHRLRLDDQ